MSYHEMACDAGHGTNDDGHAEMETMAEARHRYELQCEAEAAEQVQAEAAQAEW